MQKNLSSLSEHQSCSLFNMKKVTPPPHPPLPPPRPHAGVSLCEKPWGWGWTSTTGHRLPILIAVGGGDQGQENWNMMIWGDIFYSAILCKKILLMLTFPAIKKRTSRLQGTISLDILLCQRKSNIHSSQEKFLTWTFDSTNKDEDSFTTL